MVRKVQTRTQRATSASRHRFVLRFAGGDITVRRARPALITTAKLKAHIKELRDAVLAGKIVVKTLTQQVVDISGSEFHPVGGVAPASPKPNRRLDSVDNDKTFAGGVGESKPLYPDGAPQSQVVAPPSVTRPMSTADEVPVGGSGDPAKLRAASTEVKVPTEEEDSGEEDTEEDPDGDLDETSTEDAPVQTKAQKKAARKAARQ